MVRPCLRRRRSSRSSSSSSVSATTKKRSLSLVGCAAVCRRLDRERDSFVVLRQEPDVVPARFQPGAAQLPEGDLVRRAAVARSP